MYKIPDDDGLRSFLRFYSPQAWLNKKYRRAATIRNNFLSKNRNTPHIKPQINVVQLFTSKYQ